MTELSDKEVDQLVERSIRENIQDLREETRDLNKLADRYEELLEEVAN